MRKPRRSELGADYGGAAGKSHNPLHHNPYYQSFFHTYAAAVNTIFFAQAAASKIPTPVLLTIIRWTRDRVGLVFSTAPEASASPDGTSLTVGEPDLRSNALFGQMHSIFFDLAQNKPGVRLGQIGGKDEGVYEIDIKEPREALQMLLDFLHKHDAISCDLEVGKTYSPRGAPPLADDTPQEHLLRFLPQQAFASAAKALEAERIIARSGNVYPFSINYMEALLEQAEKGLPTRSAAVEQHLSAYRWH